MQKVKIKSIKKIERKDRYDLTVSTTNNFFANGILIHNTSAIVANVLCKPKLNPLRKFLIKIGISHERPNVYDYLYSSRKVIKNKFHEKERYLIDFWGSYRMAQKKGVVKLYAPNIIDSEFREIFSEDNEFASLYTVDYMESKLPGFKNFIKNRTTDFYGYDLWAEVGKTHFENKLHKGETVYYEIVGYKKDGGFIQGPFDYGCEVGEHKIMVYRITQTNADGIVTELQWNQVKERCEEIGVPHVIELFYGRAEYLFPELKTDEHWHENFLEKMKEKYVYDQDCPHSKNKVPAEGIVIRKEGLNIECFKLKAFRFLEYESKELDKGEVDMETQESIVEL